jgi:hypothetical protein
MSELENNVASLCRRTAEATAQAIAWCNDNTAQVRQEYSSLLREFRKFGAAATKLAKAVDRPMCVGVFGPSQAGKSYLISALARRGTHPLIADFDGVPDGLDFVRQINPEGGAESTGLVTRFSMRHLPTPQGFPVAVRLLSQADIVKIIGNSYFSDCDLSEEKIPDAAHIEAVVAKARGGQAFSGSGLSEEDVWDIQDYFERQFKGEEIIRALSAGGYWDALAEIAPHATLSVRTELFGLLWGEVEPFGSLYSRLTEALDALGHPADAFCPIEALIARGAGGFERRTNSIIDVKTLDGLGSKEGEVLSVSGAPGRIAPLTRPVLTALVAEMHVAMRERPWDFFEHTDLLDFPGARSREHHPDIRKLLKKEGSLEGLFLRGKVAYLFDRYNAEQELTGMLLCIAPSNQEVRTLPAMIKEWIDITHGADPAARARTETALFLVLTKFDAEFTMAVGNEEDSTARWSRRLHASLIDFFGKAHEWPHEWRPGQPFNNTFWLRNPNFLATHILDYDKDRVETGLRDIAVERIARSRAEYLENPDVRRHVRDPAQAWDEAFRLNDGGVTYLANSIAPICNPLIKVNQISARLALQRRTMIERLQRYYVTDDLAEQRERRLSAANQVVEHLARSASSQRFGGLLRALQISDAELSDVFFALETKSDRVRVFGTALDADTLLETVRRPSAKSKANGTSDTADEYASAVVAHWIDAMRLVATNPRVCRYFYVPDNVMSDLVDELIAGASRLDLRRQVAAQIRPAIHSQSRLKDAVVKPALLAADAIGAFVMWLGYASVPPEERPARVDDPNKRVFQPRPPMDFPQLQERPSSFDARFYGDWFNGYLAFVGDNAASVKGQRINVEQNSRLGAILSTLSPSERVARA